MAYLALARKWRPKAFSEVVGQSHVVQALSNALDSGRIHHAFLFTGTRGVGKTTLARIFAKSLNCEKGTSAEPCQECGTCLSIDEGRFVDLIEVDAASRTKVDDTREMLDNVQYAPTSGKFKVYLIDEVHMLSGHSFNALLKTLEEPPEHVKFLFATTDPQKVPVTVLSRCLQFNLRAMRPEQVENQLVKILSSEGMEFDQTALHAISKAADGSMRDGLSLLDQAIAQGGGSVHLADVENMLGTISAEHSKGLLNALAEQNVDKIMQVVADMADHAVDFVAALDELLTQLYHVCLAQIAPSALAVKDIDTSSISEMAKSVNAETIQLYYQIGLISKRDIALAPSLRVGFEMAMLRMLAFEPSKDSGQMPIESPSDGQHSSSPQLAQQLIPPTAAPQTSMGKTLPAIAELNPGSMDSNRLAEKPTRPAAVMASAPSNVSASNQNSPSIDQHRVMEQAPPAMGGASSQGPKSAQVARPTPIAVTLSGNNEWGELVEQSELVGFAKELAMHCACEKLSDDKVVLSLSPKVQHLLKPDRIAQIQDQIQKVLSTKAEFIVEVEESDKETPAECLERLGVEQIEQTRQGLHDDPGVQALMSEFGATINEQSIKPKF
jgi:DNA polymerase-3 subunit gamma/tau